jgi:integrase
VLLPTFGKQLLSEITAFGIEQWKAKRLLKCKPGTVNREFMLFKGMLTKATEWKYLVTSPAAGIRPVKGAGQRTRILTPDEQTALLKAYEKGRRRHVRPLIELLLITGARLGEMLALTWADTTCGFIRFVDTKNGKPRRLPMTAQMASILATVPRGDGTFVFVSGRRGTRYTRVLTGFKAALKDAGIDPAGVVLHTLRHTALSRMMDAGLDVRTIMEISGHSSLAMLERYTHPTEQRKAEALNTYALVTNRSQAAPLLEKTATK